MLIQGVNRLLKSPKNGTILSVFWSKLLEGKNKETEQMWHSNGLLWRKKRKGKKTEPNNVFLEACRKRQFGQSLIFLFFWGVGLSFLRIKSFKPPLCQINSNNNRESLAVTGSDRSRWRLLRKGKSCHFQLAVSCAWREEHPHRKIRGSSRSGLLSRSQVCSCSTSLTQSSQEKPLIACGTTVPPTDQTCRNHLTNVMKWTSKWNHLGRGPEPLPVWPWAGHLTSLSFGLHLPPRETVTIKHRATWNNKYSASPQPALNEWSPVILLAAVIPSSRSRAAGCGWKGKGF